MEQVVTAEATREGPQVERAESAEHFDQLALGMRFANEVPMYHRATHQQTNVSRQENPTLASRLIRQRCIVCPGIIGRIEADKAQSPRQLTEMNVGEKAQVLEGPRSDARLGTDIKGHEPRENGYSVTAPYDLIEADGQTVDENQVNLRVGNPCPFYDVLD
jgi:hypothetical protein